MNVARLLEVVEMLLAAEAETRFQKRLNNVYVKLEKLISEPANPAAQTELVQSLKELEETEAILGRRIGSEKEPLLGEIQADEFFTPYSEYIREELGKNPITPAVARDRLKGWIDRRAAYVSKLTPLRDSLTQLGFKQSSLEPGNAEIGFLLPRSLFNNHLADLIRELRDVQRIIRAFSEVATGSVEEVEVRDISTSDPQFFFGLSVATIAALGAAVTWALNTWHQVEKIRKARVEVKNVDVFSEAEIDSLFDSKIKEKINIAVEKKVNELVPDDGSPGRAKEQKTDLKWALESILAHVERGVTIEVRFLPPLPREAAEPADASISAEPPPPEFKALQEIQRGLVFPPVKDPPIMQLPAPPRAEV